jgi:hypothetical protein
MIDSIPYALVLLVVAFLADRQVTRLFASREDQALVGRLAKLEAAHDELAQRANHLAVQVGMNG